MATLSAGALTYTEWALRHDPDGKVSVLINMMSQTNAILEDMMAVECQAAASYYWTQIVALPTPTRRAYNQGVAATLSGVGKQVTTCEMYGDWVKSDEALLSLGGDINTLRAQEVQIHAEKLGQAVAYDLFYGSKIGDPLQITGLTNIYNFVTSANPIYQNVLDAGGTGTDNCSLWLVGWGELQTVTIFPNGRPTGLNIKDYDLLPAPDANGLMFPAYQSYLSWEIGLAVKDWRYNVRICNIDVSDLAGATPFNLLHGLARIVDRPPTIPMGVGPVQATDNPFGNSMPRSAIYTNRTVHTWLSIQASDKTNMLLTMQQWGGQSVLTYRGIPIRIVDALTNAETRVTA